MDRDNQGRVNVPTFHKRLAFNIVLGSRCYNPKGEVDGNSDVSIIDLSVPALQFDSTAPY